MAKKKDGRRRFGNIRKRASGRFQARYIGPDGLERTAPNTFATEPAAAKWLTLIEADIIKGEWEPPEATEVKLVDFGTRWIAERKLAPLTRQGYEDLFRLHIKPYLGKLALGVVKPQTIRTWRTKLLSAGVPEPQAVKAYSLLRAIFNTAIRPDKLIRENPCQIEGYDRYDTPERTPATVQQVFALADKMPPRFRALVVVAAFSSVRWGELAALRRCDVDLSEGTVRVPRKLAVLRTGMEFGPPKSEAGKRTVAIPEVAVEALEGHLEEFVDSGNEATVFTGSKGAYLRRSTFTRAVKWRRTCNEVGLPPAFTFHDLRHTGNNLAAASGASTKELMARMGHSTYRAALIYQNANSERDHEIAEAMEKRINAAKDGMPPRKRRRKDGDDDGSAGIPAILS
jgi:integrase